MEILEIPLHNNIFLVNNNIISVGTNKSIFFIDFIKKEKIKKYTLDLFASSICNFYGNIIFGFKKNDNLSYLREYLTLENKFQIEFECIGKGNDKTLEISNIQSFDEQTIVTSNKNKYVKIWEKTDKKPDIFYFEEYFENKLNEKDNEIKKKEIMITDLKTEIIKLKKEQVLLKSNLNQKELEIQKFNKEFEIQTKGSGEMIIIILMLDRKIHYPFSCDKDDIFIILEKKLFEVYPEIKEKECYYMCKGNLINKLKSLQENKIENGDIVLINFYQ